MMGRKSLLAVLVLALAVLLLRGLWPDNTQLSENRLIKDRESGIVRPGMQEKHRNQLYKVVEVVDGDTIKIDIGGKTESVRLIGINAPEKYSPQKEEAEYGKAAASYTKKLLQGQKVHLTYDTQHRDRYGRLLAYVYMADGTFINAQLVKAGYARVMTIPPNVKYQSLFTALQKNARDSGIGLWNLGRYRIENPLY